MAKTGRATNFWGTGDKKNCPIIFVKKPETFCLLFPIFGVKKDTIFLQPYFSTKKCRLYGLLVNKMTSGQPILGISRVKLQTRFRFMKFQTAACFIKSQLNVLELDGFCGRQKTTFYRIGFLSMGKLQLASP